MLYEVITIPHLPLFAPLQPWLERLPDGPDTQALARLADEQAIETASGCRVRFVPPKADGLAYECRIGETGEVVITSYSIHYTKLYEVSRAMHSWATIWLGSIVKSAP